MFLTHNTAKLTFAAVNISRLRIRRSGKLPTFMNVTVYGPLNSKHTVNSDLMIMSMMSPLTDLCDTANVFLVVAAGRMLKRKGSRTSRLDIDPTFNYEKVVTLTEEHFRLMKYADEECFWI